MEQKEEKPVFLKVFTLVVFLFLVSVGVSLYSYSKSSEFVGYSVLENVNKIYTRIPIQNKIFLAAQWIFFILVLIVTFVRDRRVKNRAGDVREIDISKISGKSVTDLDTLYNVLQEKKRLKVSSISKLFKVSKEIALDWCKTLESGNLVEIEYPSMGEPVVKALDKKGVI